MPQMISATWWISGCPQAIETAFTRDPEVKRELIFAGPVARPTTTLVRRVRGLVEVASERGRGFDELSPTCPRTAVCSPTGPVRHPSW